jgi:hypothetical protein
LGSIATPSTVMAELRQCFRLSSLTSTRTLRRQWLDGDCGGRQIMTTFLAPALWSVLVRRRHRPLLHLKAQLL